MGFNYVFVIFCRLPRAHGEARLGMRGDEDGDTGLRALAVSSGTVRGRQGRKSSRTDRG